MWGTKQDVAMVMARKVMQKLKPVLRWQGSGMRAKCARTRRERQSIKNRRIFLKKMLQQELNKALRKFYHLRGKGSAGALISPQDAFRPLDWIIQSTRIPEVTKNTT